MFATETTTDSSDKPVTPTLLETWGRNEWMRHVPRLDWMTHKLDVDLRGRIEKLLISYMSLDHHDPARQAIDEAARGLSHCLDRLAEAAKHERPGHPPSETAARVRWGLNHAVASLNTLDGNLIGRRYPFQTFERSKAEALYASLLAVIQHVEKVLVAVRLADPGIDERMLQGLVVLSNPVDERMLNPIA